MDRSETLALLDEAGIPYELAEHEAVHTVEESLSAHVPFGALAPKNLFLRDSKKRAYYLVSMPSGKHCTLKEIQARLESRRLSFASEEDLTEKLGLLPGSVTPLGALNDPDRTVEVILDQDLAEQRDIAVHPCDNTATILLATGDLIALLRAHGVPVRTVAFPGNG